MKKQISALMILSVMAAPVMAQEANKQPLKLNTDDKVQTLLTENPMKFEHQVFDVKQDKPMQLAELSQKEMKETEGALAPWVAGGAIGGIVGGAGYAWGAYKGNYKWDNAKFAGNVGTGAVIGASFGTAGAIASGGAKFIPSLTNAGANVWRANSAIANNGANRVWRR
ncbi:hypothetical protein CRG49_002845 [Neisseria sp. N95_16]|uniref:Uncharacterized protein n=1 Tax=Neisseria brasiliensis TaxID=2666100 RepID=A0A5Q3S0X6_9NEIS|nr:MULTISPECIES: hypothetical protein [Neisseria]MRN37664.1 hypothetical protein [Neisseria brasiliensis]PJO10289.1 hypothetical protein CRG49_002845 [Neisseria sp. N95_16]PJO79172.1 hypothetical protein CWC45_00590 [Neisseria sp. N177_16]QGL24634.1 hypothetical protein GJV52_03230 [Neisseria brasiliensis]